MYLTVYVLDGVLVIEFTGKRDALRRGRIIAVKQNREEFRVTAAPLRRVAGAEYEISTGGHFLLSAGESSPDGENKCVFFRV